MSGLAVVTIAHGRHDHLRAQRATLARSDRPPDLHVVVAMADPGIAESVRAAEGSGVGGVGGVGGDVEVLAVDAEPAGLPLAAARNRGLDHARAAGCDVLVALDVDCLVGPSLLSGYEDAVRADPDRVWSGPVTYLDPPGPAGYPVADPHALADLDRPHPARPAPAPGEVVSSDDPDLFWSLSFAMSASAWERSGGFDEAYVGYGAEDTDFGRRVLAAGLWLGWVGSARAYHQHHPVSRPPVEHLDDILRNGRTFRERWGEWPMTGWLQEMEELGLVRRTGTDWTRT